jgi:hypothetical protein
MINHESWKLWTNSGFRDFLENGKSWSGGEWGRKFNSSDAVSEIKVR